MQQFVAIIRGINVGGHNKVNMKQLRDALVQSGLDDIRTYIQSGNIVFRSPGKDALKHAATVRDVLATEFSVQVPVIVRDSKEWQRTLKRNPFLSQTGDFAKLLVTFLSEKPAAAETKKIGAFAFPHDVFAVDGKDVYMYCIDGYGKTDIPNLFFEKHLKVTGTTRNWKTVLEIGALLD